MSFSILYFYHIYLFLPFLIASKIASNDSLLFLIFALKMFFKHVLVLFLSQFYYLFELKKTCILIFAQNITQEKNTFTNGKHIEWVYSLFYFIMHVLLSCFNSYDLVEIKSNYHVNLLWSSTKPCRIISWKCVY